MKLPFTKSLVQELLDRGWLQRLWTWQRQGLNSPMPERNVIADPVETKPVVPPPPVPPPVVPPPVVPPVQPVVNITTQGEPTMPTWAKIGLGAAIAGPIAAVGTWLATYQRPTPTTTINNPPPVSSNGGDLLNWLDQEGYDERR